MLESDNGKRKSQLFDFKINKKSMQIIFKAIDS